MSHQISATHLVYRLTGSLSAPRTRKIGTLSATGLMPALLAACGSSSTVVPVTGTPVSSTDSYLIEGVGELGLFGRQLLAYDPDGDGVNEVLTDATTSLYVSNFLPTTTSRNNYHRVDEYDSLTASGWVYSGVATVDDGGEISGFARFAAGDINGDGFDDLVIGESGVAVSYRKDFEYDTDNTGANVGLDGHELASGTGRVTLLYGQPSSVIGDGALEFGLSLVSVPASGYDLPFKEQTELAAGPVLLGGILQGVGDDVAVGNVLGAANGLPEILVVSNGRSSHHARFADQLTGARISVVRADAFAGVHYLTSVDVPDPEVGDAFSAETTALWTIFTGRSFLASDGSADFAREAADSLLDTADVNGDGISDILIGRYATTPAGTNNPWTGVVNVVYGQTGVTTPTPIDLTAGVGGWEGSNNALGFSVHGFPTSTDARNRDFAGASITGVDINGDGIKDLIIGTPGNTQEFNSGQVYVIYGSTRGFQNIDVSNPNWHNNFAYGFEIKHSDPTGGDGSGVLGAGNLGASVSSAGDFNHDGIEDLAIGAPTFSTSVELARAGAVYIVFGRDTDSGTTPTAGNPTSDTPALRTNFTGNILVDQAGWTNGGQYGFQIFGTDAWARLGIVEGFGDVNGDAVDDLGISAVYGGASGSVFTIFGADQAAFGNVSIGVGGFERLREGVLVDADGEPIVTEAPVTPTVPETTAATAAAGPDAFFDVA